MRMESRQSRGIAPAYRSAFTGKRVHFIGVAGCGMAGLAQVLLDVGAIVSGSDAKLNAQTSELERCGAKISGVQDGALLSGEIDLVVRTAAIPETNREYQRACSLKLRQLKYAQLLGQVMAERLGIAISGTHGKSTTTAMASYAMLECGADPSFVIGGTVAQLGGSSRSGGGDAFVVEACEFDRSFHNYHPKVAIITNIEADHLDCYPGGLPEIIESFRTFAKLVPEGGKIIANGQDANVHRALAGLKTPVEWFGLEDDPTLDWSTYPTNAVAGCYHGQVHHLGQPVAQLKLSLAGGHNLFNATAAMAACHAAGVDPQAAADAIGRFRGVDRRMSEMGRYHDAVVVDDYGHHPTEIRTTLRALREKYSPRRLICVFQPHQHSRTRYLLEEFAGSFTDADQTILPDIYSARDTEADRNSVATQDLVDGIRRHGQYAVHLPQLTDIVGYLRQAARDGDLIVTMGAGNVCEVGRELVGS